MLSTLSYGMEQENQEQKTIRGLWQVAAGEGLAGADLINTLLIEIFPMAGGILSETEEEELKRKRKNVIEALKEIQSTIQGFGPYNIDALAQQVILAKKAMNAIIQKHNDQWPYKSVPTDQWNEAVAQEAISVSKTHNIYIEGILAIINGIIDTRAKTKGSVQYHGWLGTVRNPLDSQLIEQTKENIVQALETATKTKIKRVVIQKKEAEEAPKIALPIQQEKEQINQKQNEDQIITLWNTAKGKLYKGKPYTGNMLLNDILINSLTAIDLDDAKKAEKEAKNNALIKILQQIQADQEEPSTDDISVLADKVLKVKMAMNVYIHNADNEWPANSVPTAQWNKTIAIKAIEISLRSQIHLSGVLNIISKIIDQKAMTKARSPMQLFSGYSSLDPKLITIAKKNILDAIRDPENIEAAKKLIEEAQQKNLPKKGIISIKPQTIIAPAKTGEKAVLPQPEPSILAPAPAQPAPTKTTEEGAALPQEGSSITTPTQLDPTKAERVPISPSPQGEPSIAETTQFIPVERSKKTVTRRGRKRTQRRRGTKAKAQAKKKQETTEETTERMPSKKRTQAQQKALKQKEFAKKRQLAREEALKKRRLARELGKSTP
jgi:hypothetical protein